MSVFYWPDNFETVKVRGGKLRPKNPPSIWPTTIPPSQIPTTSAPKRTTLRTSNSVRNSHSDELEEFLAKDKVTFSTLKDELICKQRKLQQAVLAFLAPENKEMVIKSFQYKSGIPMFTIKLYEDLRFEAYHYGIKCHVSALASNRITAVSSWSILDEIIRFLSSKELDNKEEVMLQQVSAMGPRRIGEKLYSPEMIVRSFGYFATSRALYSQLRNDYQLPSASTLTRITSKVSKIDEKQFLELALQHTQENQKLCLIFHDEVYIKKMLLFHGGTIFGRSEDNPSELAKTMLGMMIYCLNGGPKILTKMIPVSKLQSSFLFEQINATSQCVNAAGAQVKAIICDGNRVNQACFKMYDTIPGEPWLTVDGKYLLFDFVHLLKNIRNLWLTEKNGELIFFDNGLTKVAKWAHLKKLFDLENESLVKLSDLNEVSVFPKPIERQRVSTCLRIFSEKTHQALLTHPLLNQEEVRDTADFIYKVLSWWKILNVKTSSATVKKK